MEISLMIDKRSSEKSYSRSDIRNVWNHNPEIAGKPYIHEDKYNRVTTKFYLNHSQVRVDRSLFEAFDDAKRQSEAERRVARYIETIGKLWI